MNTSNNTLFPVQRTKIEEAQEILSFLGLPTKQQNEISALTLLALCSLKTNDNWSDAIATSQTISNDIMAFVNEHYNKGYKPNTRETFRRQVLHQFVDAGIVLYNPDNPRLPINSSKNHYRITNEVIEVLKKYGTPAFIPAVNELKSKIGSLFENYNKKREIEKIPIKLPDGRSYNLSPGRHNEIQKAVVEQFASRYAKNGELLYIGDTEDKYLYFEETRFIDLGIRIEKHSKLPDVIIYLKDKNWLFLIEVVTAHGPVSQKRINELEKLLENCTSARVYVTAFPDRAEFRKHIADIAWETEVWIADSPDHLIHFNGEKFLGPYLTS